MSRELKRVPAGWEHPRQDCTHSPWRGGCDDAKANGGRCFKPMHVPKKVWKPERLTHYQLYETVSEGTPVSPVFATESELVAYLADYGDFWDQHPNTFTGEPARGGWGQENAEAFVRGGGWMPSLVMQGGRKLEPKDLFPKPARGIRFGKL